MSLPYENASSGAKALAECEKILRRFGCDRFGTMTDWARGCLVMQFEHRGRQVHLEASWQGYAGMWLKENPWTEQRHSTKDEWDDKARRKGEMAGASILRDWVKAQITAVEIGLMPFDCAFMPHMLAHDGRRLIEHALPLLEGPKDD